MKSKLRPEQIIEINRICIERFGKSPISTFRCWCNDVVLKLISATDKVVFNAVLSYEFATPDCDEWRKKHEISLHDIEDELLLANSESIQPLNEIKVKWLKEWFADHADIGGDVAEVAKGSTLTPDYEKLRAYFKPGFMGMGEGSFNYFDEYLRKDLNTISKKNEMGMVAYLVYHGEHFKNKTMKFADWLRVFFSSVGVELPKNLAMSRYKPNGKISSLFRYL